MFMLLHFVQRCVIARWIMMVLLLVSFSTQNTTWSVISQHVTNTPFYSLSYCARSEKCPVQNHRSSVRFEHYQFLFRERLRSRRWSPYSRNAVSISPFVSFLRKDGISAEYRVNSPLSDRQHKCGLLFILYFQTMAWNV